MRVMVRIAALVPLLAFSQLATAGPIEWSYRAVDNQGAVLRDVTGLTASTWSDHFMLDPLVHGVSVPDPIPDNDLRTDILRYQATVRITDVPSGDTWDVVLFLDYRTQYEWRNGAWDPYFEGYTGGPWPGEERTLGDNTYRVSGPGGEMLVTVTNNPTAATPEPGTLALAGLGLGGLGVVRRLRKGRATPGTKRGGPTMSTVIRLAAVAALLALPSLAVAGPIGWSYHTEVTYAQDYGSNFIVTLAPDGTLATEPGDRGSAWLFSSTGVARPDPGFYEARYEFTLAVTIIDLASGQSGTVGFDGSYSSLWMYQPEDAYNLNAWRWEYAASNFGDFGSWRTLQLGNNQYELRGYGGGNGIFPYGELDVVIHPTAATPEPTTLALAGLGLCGTGLARRLRRE